MGWKVNVDVRQLSAGRQDRYDLYEALIIREIRFCIKMHRPLRRKARDY